MRPKLVALLVTAALVVLAARVSSVGKGQPAASNDLAQMKGSARLILVVVMDGLRPDSINRDDTPTLFRLRQEGVTYINSHSVFPTVTRVNAAAISTGTYPDVNGLVSNSMFVPAVNPNHAFNTGDYHQLLKLRDTSNGRLLFARSLAERLVEHRIGFVALSSGSTGNALLLNHRAPEGIAFLLNGGFDPGKRVAYPDQANSAILARFGAAPPDEGAELVDWTDRVLREYVLPELKPEVAIDWQTEPDGSQHRYGTSSPEARKALANNDRNLALTLAVLRDHGLADKTDLIVLSDHGFSLQDFRVDATQSLIEARLKASADSDDVVLASNGQSVLVHVKGRDSRLIRRIVRYLQKQDWVDLIFTAGSRTARKDRMAKNRMSGQRRSSADELGWVSGTFSLRLIRQSNAERGADILFTMPWSSSTNTFGAPGKHHIDGTGGNGPLSGNASGHGGMSPWVVRNTLILWGADFKRGVTIRTPAANVDIAPTILALKGIGGGEGLDGRPLVEAFRDGPDQEQMESETRLLRVDSGGYHAVVQVSDVGSHRYIDKGWRIK
jgi:predicted AlkP superfamily pyrophosphatase or phosphodiesterase